MTHPSRIELIGETKSIVADVVDGSLQGALEKREFARLCGISPQHLSYIVNGKRMPSPTTAKRMSDQMRKSRLLSSAECKRWFEYTQDYSKFARRTQTNLTDQLRDSPTDLIDYIRKQHQIATYESDLKRAAEHYQAALDAGDRLQPRLGVIEDDLLALELLKVLHDTYSVVGRHSDALWAARRARWLSDNLDRNAYRKRIEQVDSYEVNSRRAEIVALNNLRSFRRAYDLSLEVEELEAYKKNALSWKPHLYRDRLSSLARLPWSPIREAEMLAREVGEVCEHRGDTHDELLVFLITRSLARTYNSHRQLGKSLRLLERARLQMDQVPHIGALHKVLFLRTYADACWLVGDAAGWTDFSYLGIRTARLGKLYHQLGEMQADSEYRRSHQPPRLG